MIEYSLLGYAMYSLFIGFAIGVLKAWNKKVVFFIIVGLTIFMIIGISLMGVDTVYEGYKSWMLLWQMMWVIIGIKSGEIIYESTFGK